MEHCDFCELETAPDIKIYFKNEFVFYCQNEKYQGALKYSGCIVPTQHRDSI